MATYTFTSINTVENLQDKQDENTKNIVRIYGDPDIKPTIVLDELSVENFENPDGKKSSEPTEGLEMPVIRINDYIINQGEIDYLVINSTGFIPTINLTLSIEADTFLLKNTPKDGDIISIALRPKSDIYKTIRNDYVIKKVSTTQTNEKRIGKQTISLSGELFVPGLDSDKSCFGFIGTSKDAFKDAAKRLGLGFAFNDEDNTEDYQVWLCYTESIRDYLKDVLSHAWKNEISFYKAWIDTYYNLTYVDMNKTLLDDESNTDMMALTSAIRDNYENPVMEDIEQDNALLATKGLINHEIYKNTTSYISNWSVTNNSTSITFDLGTEIVSNTFRHNQNIFNDGGEYNESVSNVPAYDQTKKDYIILRGRAISDASSDVEQQRANYSYKDIYVRKPWTGIEYVMSDTDSESTDSTNTWSGNTHINYNRAVYHNLINIRELDKLYITVTVNGLNTQIIRGDKIPIVLYLSDENKAKMVNAEENAGIYNYFYSGFYYVDGVKYIYEHPKDETQMVSGYRTEFVLKRREWPVPFPDKVSDNG